MTRVLECDVGVMAEHSHVPHGPSEARECGAPWPDGAIAVRDRADISFAFEPVWRYLNDGVAEVVPRSRSRYRVLGTVIPVRAHASAITCVKAETNRKFSAVN